MNKRYLEPVNPATGEKLPKIAVATHDEIDQVVRQARFACQNSWRYLSYEERGRYLIRAGEELIERSEEIAKIITSEMGRVLTESRGEVTKSGGLLKYFAADAEKNLQPHQVDLGSLTLPEKKAHVINEPRGVAAIIKPWNAPVQQAVWAIGPALMAGCSVILKPSEYTPHSSLELQRAFDRAGLPSGVISTLIGDGEIGAYLANADVDLVSFTGSLATGKKIAEAVGRRARKTVLELSGKDALIVCDDVDLDFAASGIVYGAFSNCGHWCSSIERVYMPKSIAKELTAKVVNLTKQLRVGNGLEAGMDMGPIANQRQFEIVSKHISDAKEAGATILTGGYRLTEGDYAKGLFFAPTVITNVNHEMRIMRENVFGPMVTIMTYDTIDEAIALANDTNYGLGTSIWTQNEELADYIIPRIDSGIVWVNEPLQSIASCTWSVTKDSGYGGELGASGYKEYTYEKVVISQYENNKPRSWYFPYQK